MKTEHSPRTGAVTMESLVAGTGMNVVRGCGDVAVRGITDDSRRVEPGFAFVARTGTVHRDGKKFVPDALGRGAVAVISDDPATDCGADAVFVLCPRDRQNLPDVIDGVDLNRYAHHVSPLNVMTAILAERFFGRPSTQLKLLGVTGTNGKTTTAHLIHQLLTHAGHKCGLIGTVLTHDGENPHPSNLTTPSSIDLSKTLADMVRNGCSCLVMEVSSHALDQGRVAALKYDAAIFTNLTGDHLDYHRTMEAYASAKAMLFESLEQDAVAIVNADDGASERMLRNCQSRRRFRTHIGNGWHGAAGQDEMSATIKALLPTQTSALFDFGPFGSFACDLPLIGKHNVSNALQAGLAVLTLGVSIDSVNQTLHSCSAPPGRLEPVTRTGDPFGVFVDYAHTDDALENVLNAVRPIMPRMGRLTVVFGCGGDRDKTKRPRMAGVACRLADRVFITSDNPRTENPDRVVEDILAGVPAVKRECVTAIVDRRTAICQCIAQAQAGDMIVIAGKGHEDYQIIGTTRNPFDDRVVAREALRTRAEMNGSGSRRNVSAS